MVFVSAGVAGPRPSNASEEIVLTSLDSRWVLKVGVSVVCALAHAKMMNADESSRFTGNDQFGGKEPAILVNLPVAVYPFRPVAPA